jgi:hypothetical protein
MNGSLGISSGQINVNDATISGRDTARDAAFGA